MTHLLDRARSMERRRIVLATAYVVVLLSCDDPLSPEGGGVARIDVTPASLALDVGTSRPLVARLLDDAGASIPGAKAFWSTENPAVATVSQAGVVTGNAAGSTRVAVSSRGASTTVPVTVSALPVARVQVTPPTSTMQVGGAIALRADAFNAVGDTISGRPVTWQSAHTDVASVSAEGVVTGIAPGLATISATVDGATGSALVKVEAVPVASVVIAPDSAALLTGQAVQLTVQLFDAAGLPLSGRNVAWSSSAPTIAPVSSTGRVNALAPGTARITATSEGKQASASITVARVPVDAVSITPSAATTTIGQRLTLTARTLDSTGAELSDRAVTWTSDAPGIATVDAAGVVSAVAQGRAIVTATSEGKTGSSTITVTPIPVSSLTVEPTTVTLTVGSALQLVATPRDAQGAPLTGRVVTWLSGAPSVATVGSNGVVTAIGVGTALIVATSEGKRATVTLTATPAPVALVSVDPPTAMLNPDSSQRFIATARDLNGRVLTGRTTGWSSSNISVATISATGLAAAHALGTSRITATVDGIAGTADLTVALIPVARVVITPPSTSLVEGTTTTLSAAILDSLDNPLIGRGIVWSSSDVAVATVSPIGIVSAIAPGTATITAVAPNAGLGGASPSGAATVDVTFAEVASVTIQPSAPSVVAGSGTQLTATLQSASPAMPLDSTGRTLTWSVADPSIATISATGLVTGLVPGTTTVTLTAASPGQATPATGSVTLTVSVVPIARIVITPLPGTIHVGTLYARQVSAQAFDGSNNPLPGRTIAWRTTNAARLVASPASSGTGISTLTALTAPAGAIRVIASAPGATGTVADTITVSSDLVPVASVSVSPTSATLNPLETQAVVATPADSAGNVIGTLAGDPLAGRATTWSSANAAIGTVSAAGLVTAVAVGSTTIGATIDGRGPANFALTVVPVPVASVSVAAGDSTLSVGDVTQGAVVARDAAGNVLSLTGRSVAWSSGSASIASVSATGTITAVGAGNTFIGVTVDGVGPATFPLMVTSPVVVPLPVATVTIAAPDSSVVVGTPVQAVVVARDTLGNVLSLSGRSVVWTSRTPGVATISSTGLVTTIAPGGSIIGVTVDGVGPASFPLTVLPVPVSTVAITAPDSSITAGDVIQGSVVARDAANNILSLTGRTVTWTSSVTAVASVSTSGAITAIGAGTSTIGVTVDGVGPATFTLRVAPRPVASVSVTAVDSSLTTGTTAQATVVARDAQNTALSLVGRTVVWSSSATGVATVSSTGLVTAVAPGSATIGVTVDGVGPATFVVTVSPPSVASVSVSAPDSSVTVGDIVAATAQARDAGGATLPLAGRAVAWSSSVSTVASVSSSGAITALAPGTTTIGVTVDGVGPATFTMTVSAVPVAAVSVTATDSSLTTGTTAQATVVARDAANNILALTGRTVVWSSSVTSVATVSVAGLITAVAPGTTTIAVTVDGVGPATLTVTVAPPSVATVSIAAPDSSVTAGDVVQSTVVARDAGGNKLSLGGRRVSWSSSATSVATISGTGLVTTLTHGTTTIGVTVDGVGPATFVLNVAAVPVASVSVSAADSSITSGQTVQATAEARDAANNVLSLAGRAVVWSSSATGVATVNGAGLVTAVSAGTATISVSVDGVGPATFLLTVAPPSVAAVSITAPDSSVTAGDVVQAAVVARDAGGTVLPLTGRQVNWSSSATGLATISGTGLITTLTPGTTTIGVTVDGVGPATFVLNVAAVPVATVSVSAADSSLTAGTTTQATVVARDAANNVLSLPGRSVVWSSGATGVATVNGSGLVTALSAGTTTIGVTVDGVGPATFVLTVSPPAVATVSITAPDSSVTAGTTLQAAVLARDAANNPLPLTGRTIAWSSSAPQVASISSTGLISALGPGTTTVGVTVDGVGPATFVLTVAAVPVATVSVSVADSSITTGQTVQATAVARDAANTVLSLVGRTVVWSSSATNVATVNGAGLVTALAAGTTTIGVTVDGVGPASFLLTVAPPSVATVSITAPDSSVTAGDVVQATVVARDAGGNALSLGGRQVSWSSSASGVATISGTGLITTLAPGTTTIGVTVDGVGPATFVLSAAAVPVATVSVSSADSSITMGQTVQAAVVARDAAGSVLALTGRAVVWASSATGVAAVSGTGLVTAVSAGTATIGVTVDGIGPATFLLTVSPPSVATVSITAPDSSVTAGDVVQATVVARDAANNPLPLTGRSIAWSSSAQGVALISSTGLISALSAGSATIGVTVDGVGPATFVLNVVAVPVATVSISAADSSITSGQTVQATVEARDAANNLLSLSGRSVAWSSSTTGVATVNGAGLVTAVSAGTADISVTVDGVGPATFALTVAPPSVATVSITAPDSSVTAGDVVQATAVARDVGGTVLSLGGRQVNWSSSATGVATISGTGLITTLTPGATTIGVTVDGVGPATFVLNVAAVPVATVSVSAADSSITSGQTVQATAEARDAANNFLSLSGRAVSWSSSATGVATVNGSGLVTAVSPGTTTISVTVDGIGPATFLLTVAPPSVATVSITAPDSSVTAGDVVQAAVVARDAGGNVLPLTGRSIAWTSSAQGVASISGTGLISALGAGTTTIGVTVDGIGPATFTLDVTPAAVATVSVSAPDSSITTGQTVQATAVARDAANTFLSLVGRTVVWSSSATNVATVNGSGLVTALAAGTTTIGVTVDGVGPATFVVSVTAVPVASVGVSAADSSLTAGTTTQATAVARDAANNVLSLAGRSVVWSSSATGVATVNGAGLVTAVSPGTTTISVTVDGIGPATFLLTVAPPPVATVTISAPDSSIAAGTTLQAAVVARDAANNPLPLTGRTIAWSSSAQGVASISSTGLIAALGAGTTTIGVTVDGIGPAIFTLDVTPAAVATVSVSATDSTLTTGQSSQATAVARDAAGNVLALTGRAVVWTSSTTGVATVDGAGLVTAVSAGTSTVSVTVDGVGPATFLLTVSPPSVATVSIAAPDSSVTAGDVVQAAVVARDAGGTVLPLTGRQVNWSSSATGVATISSAGLIATLAPGTTTIGVTVDGIGPATFTLDVMPAPVASVSVSAADSSLTTGQTILATVVARDAANNILSLSGRAVFWSSSATGVATVNGAGLVTAVSPGTTTISVSVDGVGPATFLLTVSPPSVATVSITAPDSSVTAGDVVQAAAVARDAGGNVLSLGGRQVSWSSSATSVATISGTGLITTMTLGTTTIGVTVDGVGPATFVLNVAAVPVATVSVSATDSSLTTGETTQAAVVARDAGGAILSLAGRAVNWTSSAPSVATVTGSGLVSAVGPGSSIIAVTVDGVGPATLQLTVVAAPVATVTITAPDSSVFVGDVVTAVVQASDAAGNLLSLTGRTVAWTSSATGIATVSSTGVITALAAGASTIGVTVDGIGPASFPLTVANIPVASVTVSAPDSSVTVGDPPVQASVEARDGSGNLLSLAGRVVAWTSSNTLIATVSSSGVVAAVGAGSTTVGVTVDGMGPASFTFTVAQVPVDRVDVAPTTATLQVGEMLNASATPRDAAGNALTNRTIAWSLDNTKASVSPTSGAATSLTALDSGVVVLSASSEGQTGTATITISLVPVDTVQSSPPQAAPSVTLLAGAGSNSQEMFRAISLTAGNLAGRAFTVTSSDSSRATVAAVGTPLTDNAGKGEFIVTLTAAAVAGDTVKVSVTIEGKVTVWTVTVR